MNNVFVIETLVERTLPEFLDVRDAAVQFSLFTVIDSPNFHWCELRLRNEVIRLEAVRSTPEPNHEYAWQWPESYRLQITKGGRKRERMIQRGKRGAGLQRLELAGMTLPAWSHLRVMQREDFVFLSFQVGRLTKTIRPHGSVENAPASNEENKT